MYGFLFIHFLCELCKGMLKEIAAQRDRNFKGFFIIFLKVFRLVK